MAHYAFLDENNIVTEVITGKDESEVLDGLTPEEWYGDFRGQRCLRTSINGNIRKNFAGIGYSYNEEHDAFIAPKPYNSWVLDEETCKWSSPVSYPNPEPPYSKMYNWDEDTVSWDEVVHES
jgi:hypothetical protein